MGGPTAACCTHNVRTACRPISTRLVAHTVVGGAAEICINGNRRYRSELKIQRQSFHFQKQLHRRRRIQTVTRIFNESDFFTHSSFRNFVPQRMSLLIVPTEQYFSSYLLIYR